MRLFIATFLLLSFSLLGAQEFSGNPIIKHIRTADPSAQVWNDGKVWVYTSHDQNDAVDYSSMDGYHVFSSEDMIQWTDHGEILHSRDVAWAISQGGFMFAPDAAYKDGTYYLYFPTMAEGWKWRIGVATSETPEGPFTDVGHYIEGTDHIDPACFIDEDGQAYLIWGGDFKRPKIARLKENMIELAEEPRFIEYGADNFGEGAFMHKRDGIYYFSYTCQSCSPFGAYYAMGDNPYGPFQYKGELKKGPPGAQDHHSIIDFHGQGYYFYHTGNYNGGSLFRRNVCVDSLHYNEDGTMKVVEQTTIGVGKDLIGAAEGVIVPGRLETEDYFRQSRIDSLWFEFVLEVLGSEQYAMTLKLSDPLVGSLVYILVDEEPVDTIEPGSSEDTLRTDLFLHQGKHSLKFVFGNSDSVSNLMEIDWIDLYGQTEYNKIQASATEGGTILPEGTFYLQNGDSASFTFDWEVNYRPDSLLIDGLPELLPDSYIFQDILGDHTIEARFAACSGTVLNPWLSVNEEGGLNDSILTLIEGDDLKLWVEFEGEGNLSWILPSGQSISENELLIENIPASHGGIYSAIFISSLGCKSIQDFSVSVNPLVLEVYQAERWSNNFGTQSEVCSDAGGTHNLSFIENGDWSSFEIEIEESGIYEVTARVATALVGGEIEFWVENQLQTSLPVSGTLSDGWQDWYTTAPAEAEFEKGENELKLVYKGGEGYLFNLNWFDLEFIQSLPTRIDKIEKATGQFYAYPNPAGPGVQIFYTIENEADVDIRVLNLMGLNCRTLLKSPGGAEGRQELFWDGTDDRNGILSGGIYFLVFTSGQHREVQKIVLVK